MDVNKNVGALILRSSGLQGIVCAGPYRDAPEGGDWFRICLAPELDDFHQVPGARINIVDFGVPKDEKLFRAVVRYATLKVLRGERVYVGCLGGIGRTGTFLASMAKLCGQDHPIAYVRREYDHRAVETKKQEDFIHTLNVSLDRWKLRASLLPIRIARWADRGLARG